jgi:phosphoribosylamine--glycine ligase
MRVLGIGSSCDLGDMYLRLAAEGHEVRVYVEDYREHGVMDGMLERVADFRLYLDWVRDAGSEGLVLFETADRGTGANCRRSCAAMDCSSSVAAPTATVSRTIARSANACSRPRAFAPRSPTSSQTSTTVWRSFAPTRNGMCSS